MHIENRNKITKKLKQSNKNLTAMKKQTLKVSRERAIIIAMNHNCVSREIAESYTDCELKEVLKHASGSTYKLVANF